jgi:hypothetical protein
MSEAERESIRLAIGFYMKWREGIIETDEDWDRFAKESGELVQDLSKHYSRIGLHLFDAVMTTFNDLYQNGRKPVPANYFGRDDLST